MSLVSSAQQMASALSSSLAGLIIVRSSPTGRLENYGLVGALAVGFSLIAFFLSLRIQAIDNTSQPISDVNSQSKSE